ncbi:MULTISPECIES: hypothetical protein [Streptomycetaceae]|uniref:hypothetical protein n=1 Tax=Embleya scabrispora TaxID=159449 RepID=UPI00099E66B3|nr:hypothetical protein [Streptomyces sp. SID5474]
MYREIGDRRRQADTLDSLGDARRMLGDHAGAEPLYREELDLYRDIGNRLGQALALTDLSHTHRALDR